jgi:putative DNA primase/helicase
MGKEVAAYDYHDENGKLLYQVVRFEPKDFRQRRPNGEWFSIACRSC